MVRKNIPFGAQPASPCDTPVTFHDSGEVKATAAGITVRDFFAAQALAGFCASDPDDFDETGPKAFAKLAYEYADAMLAEREKKPDASSS